MWVRHCRRSRRDGADSNANPALLHKSIRRCGAELRKWYRFKARDTILELGPRTLLMGILNVTPDSFSDGGCFYETRAAVEQGLRLAEIGADIIDIGGESTRPGSRPVLVGEELSRVLPVVEELSRLISIPISIDTTKSEVARRCLEAGASIVNDISALQFDPEMGDVVRRFNAGIVLMHMRGEPGTMHLLEASRNILEEVMRDLGKAIEKARDSGIPRDRIMVDPGIGFGKNTRENLQILNRLSMLESFDLPILVGPSRKSFIGRILKRQENDRLFGTAAASAAAILHGAHALRIHDVAEIRQVSDVIDAIETESGS